ncbi:MAG: hypothetical protein H0V09_02795 [Gemmatimonadetes bacterium]|nr:hypothetical protein [Gemmatimonadota bacterium]
MRDRRVELREEILELEARKHGVGIGGVKTCQACGKLGRYSGWAGAMAAHRHGPFIALQHRHGAVEIEAALGGSAPRYCATCGALAVRVQRTGAVEPDPLCVACAAAGADLGRVSRSRWLDELHPTERSMRERLRRVEHAHAMEGTAPSMEIARVRLALTRALRGLRRRIGRFSRRV